MSDKPVISGRWPVFGCNAPMPGPSNPFHVDPNIAKAWALASSLYTDAGVYMLVKEKIFSRP